MTATFETAALASALKQAASIVEARNTIPIVACALFEIDGDKALITSSDLTIWHRQSIACDASGAFKFAVDAKALSRVVSNAPAATVKLSIKDGRLTISSGRSRFTLPTIAHGDYPMPREDNYVGTVAFNGEALNRAMSRAFPAVSSEETRYYLNGEFMHIADRRVWFVATDGHRLAKIGADECDAVLPDTIIGTKAVRVIMAMANEGDVSLSVSPTNIRAEGDSTTIISKVVEGTYPDYARVIPPRSGNVAHIDAATLAAAIARCSSVTDMKGSAMRLEFGEGQIAISIALSDGSAAQDSVECEYAGEPVTLGMNYNYSRDLLRTIDGNAKIYLDTATSAVRIEQVSAPDDVFVIMPMRL